MVAPMTNDVGDSDDPAWAWYWDEVAKEDAQDARGRPGVRDPHDLWFLEDRVEAMYAPPSPYGAPVRRDFRRIVRWLPLPEREVITFAYKKGKPRGTSLWASFNQVHEQDLTQQLWSLSLKRAEEWVVHLANVYKDAGSKGSLRGALKRVEWPDVLTAYVDAGSTAKASRTAGCAQDTVYRRVKAMSETEPMVAALMAWHRRPARDLARRLRHRTHPKNRAPRKKFQ